jgi:phosphonopyruvate decarboxylase
MVNTDFFCEKLFKAGTDFFTGVPDSLLKDFCAYITNNVKEENHIIAANEGAAVGLASGYHLATGKIPLVYMQNSGLGNAVNPLLSLADSDVYQIPMILLIGWRGEPGVKDEPQHIKQGKVTCSLLETMGIPYSIMSDNHNELEKQLSIMYEHFSKNNSPYALVARKDTFAGYKKNISSGKENQFSLTREAAIKEILTSSASDELYVSTTGMASRELYELRKNNNMPHFYDFLTVGSMGHASQIAFGLALQKPGRLVTCLDGDGSFLMHTGSLAIIGNRKPANFRHIILNNGAHDSVGGQPTVGLNIDIPAIALACGYERAYTACNIENLRKVLKDIDKEKRCGPVLLEVRLCKGARADLGRPCTTPLENKKLFMDNLL